MGPGLPRSFFLTTTDGATFSVCLPRKGFCSPDTEKNAEGSETENKADEEDKEKEEEERGEKRSALNNWS